MNVLNSGLNYINAIMVATWINVYRFAVSTMLVSDCQVLGSRQGLKKDLMWQSSYLVKHCIKVCISAEKQFSVFEHCFTIRHNIKHITLSFRY